MIFPALFGVLALISILAFGKTAHAGLVSLVSSLWGSDQASAAISQSTSASDPQSETMELLTAAANPDPDPNKPAEVVPIDGNDTLVPDIASVNATSTDTNTTISVYVVRPGDNISTVAKMFQVSVNTVLWANNLTSKSVLQPGQTLTILPISGITYVTKKGDTVKSIASRYNADSGDILAYNDLASGTPLPVGLSILIPDGELSAAETVHNSQSSGKAPKGTLYEPLLDGWNYPLITDYYECPLLPGVGHLSQGLHGHNAVDLAAPIGTPIHAAHDGTVIIAKMGGWNGGYGNFVVISHPNGTQTLYAHMLREKVSPGDPVSEGDVIGYIGMTGLTTGPHVHFEVRGAQNVCLNYH